jgi:hypothetical protein
VAIRVADGRLGAGTHRHQLTVLTRLLLSILRQRKNLISPTGNLKVRLMSMTLQTRPDLSLSAISIKDSAFETVPLFSDELVAILPPNWGICRGCPHFGPPLILATRVHTA